VTLAGLLPCCETFLRILPRAPDPSECPDCQATLVVHEGRWWRVMPKAEPDETPFDRPRTQQIGTTKEGPS
jgi:hypothetical protein